MTNDPASTAAFQAVTEAYSVLGDEDKRSLCVLSCPSRPLADRLSRVRRSYDRSLGMTSSPQSHTGPLFYETTRHRGATHAWDHASRLGRRRSQRRAPQPTWTAHDASSSFARDRVLYAKHTVRPGQTEADRVRRESSLWRALQVISIVVLVSTLGRWGAS